MSFFFIDDDSSGPTSISFVSSTLSSSASVTCPTVQLYDVGILWDVAGANTGSTPSTVVPSGWTSIANVNVDAGSFSTRAIMSYKIFAGTEGGSSITGMNASGMAKIMALFRPDTGASVSSLVLQSPWNAIAADANFSAQTISASGQAAPLIRIAGAGRVASGTPAQTLSGTFDATVITTTGTNTRANLGYAVQNSAPSDDAGIDDNIASGTHSLVSGWIKFL